MRSANSRRWRPRSRRRSGSSTTSCSRPIARAWLPVNWPPAIPPSARTRSSSTRPAGKAGSCSRHGIMRGAGRLNSARRPALPRSTSGRTTPRAACPGTRRCLPGRPGPPGSSPSRCGCRRRPRPGSVRPGGRRPPCRWRGSGAIWPPACGPGPGCGLPVRPRARAR